VPQEAVSDWDELEAERTGLAAAEIEELDSDSRVAPMADSLRAVEVAA